MNEMTTMFNDEILVKDNIIDQTNAVKEAFIEKTRRLCLKLKIPREHYVFLLKTGALEEFVDAKLLGKEPEAKWNLMGAFKD